MRAFAENLKGLSAISETIELLKKNNSAVSICGVADAAKPHISAVLNEGFDKCLIVTYDEQRGRLLSANMSLFGQTSVYYPPRDVLFYQSDVSGKLIESERISAVKYILSDEKITAVTTYDALLDIIADPDSYDRSVITLKSGDEADKEKLEKKIAALGYERCYQVSARGEFAVRGGIIDVYPLTAELPFRIEFWGDEIDTVRSFDPESQRSNEELDEASIYPASDLDTSSKMSGILDYFDEEKTLVILDEPVRLIERGDTITEEFTSSIERRKEIGLEIEGTIDTLRSSADAAGRLQSFKRVMVTELDTQSDLFPPEKKYSMDVKSLSPYNNKFELLIKDL